MLDIVKIESGKDLVIANSAVMKAANVLSVQLASLEYAPDFGVDLEYFLNSEFQIPNASFQSYLVQRIVQTGINVSQVLTTIQAFYNQYTFYVDESQKNDKGLIK